jgi:tripartite ATP-independent transporter DctM subunit
MTLALLGIAILALMLLRVPMGFALLGPCLAYMILTGQSLGLSVRLAANGVDSWPLLAVPLFILVGVIANHASIADRLFEFALSIFGRIRASLAYVNIGVSLGFAWMSGAALADAAGVGKIEVPHMVRNGYPPRFSVGLTAASTLISPIMPPSIPAIVYAAIASVSTGALFATSVVPALLMTGGLAIAVYVWARPRTDMETTETSWRRFRSATVGAVGVAGAPIVILGGILGGLFTPTEAAAVGAVYLLVLGMAYGDLRPRDVPRILVETASATAGIMIILAASALLSYILAREQVPQLAAEAMLGVTDSPVIFLLMVNVLLILLGMVIEPTSALVISVPILLPVATQFGIDPLHFGVIAILNLMIGLLTPPVGAVCYVLSSVTGIPVHEVFSGAAPFLIPLLIVQLIVTFVPDLVLFAPRALGL